MPALWGDVAALGCLLGIALVVLVVALYYSLSFILGIRVV